MRLTIGKLPGIVTVSKGEKHDSKRKGREENERGEHEISTSDCPTSVISKPITRRRRRPAVGRKLKRRIKRDACLSGTRRQDRPKSSKL